MIKIRQISEDDFLKVTRVLNELPFRIPKYTVSTLGRSNPEQFFVAETETGDVVGCVNANNVSDKLAYVGLFAVSQSHKGQGIDKLLWTEMLKSTGDRTLYHVPTEMTDPVFRNDLGFTNERFLYAAHYGTPKVENLKQNVNNITIKPLTEEMLPQLSEYDYSITKLRRREYLKQLLFEPETLNLVAVEEGSNQIKGFASLAAMLTDEMPVIFYPLYADTTDIAEVLIQEAFEKHELTKERRIAIVRINSNKEAKKICEKLNLPEQEILPLLATSTMEEVDLNRIISVGSLAAFFY